MSTSRIEGLRRVLRGVQSHMKSGLRAAAMALALGYLMPVAHVQAQRSQEHEVRDIRSLNYTEKQQLLERIRTALRNVIDQTEQFEGQAEYTPLKLQFRTQARNEVLVIDLGAANGPVSHTADMSELETQLENTMADLLDRLGISYPDVHYEFGGRDSYYYNPENRKYLSPPQAESGESAIPPQGAKVVISAMHGYYWRLIDNVWAKQRPTESNGIF